MKIKIILLENIKKIGKKYDIVEVSSGYAYNFLIPKKSALLFNKKNLNFIKKEQQKESIKIDHQIESANKIKLKLESVILKFSAKKSPNGKMIGIISDKQIIEELKKFNIIIDKKQFIDKKSVDTFGESVLKLKLFTNIIGKIKVFVEEK